MKGTHILKSIFCIVLAGMLLLSLSACGFGKSGQAEKKVNADKAKLEEQKQKGKEAADAAIDFLNNLTDLRWDEACAMAENELETKMPGINDLEWGVTDESMVVYEDILRACLRGNKTITANREAVAFSDGQCVVTCEVSVPKLQTVMDMIAANGWKTPEDAELNAEMVHAAPKETVYVTLLMKEEKEQDGLMVWKVCAESDIRSLAVIFN